ncbi:MAG: hypothetical protein AB7L94_23495 [Kofleriaceae bacterium]
MADERAGLDAGRVIVAESCEHVTSSELADGLELRRCEREQRIVVAPWNIELRVQVFESAHEHLFDLVELPLSRQSHGAGIVLEPVDERTRQLGTYSGVDVIETRDHDDRRRNCISDRSECIERLLEPSDRLTVGNCLFDLIDDDHQRRHLELVHDRGQLLQCAERILGLVSRRESTEQRAVMPSERLAAEVFDDPALKRGIATLEQEQRVEEIGLQRFEPLGPDDSIDHAADGLVELFLGELGGSQALELVRWDGHSPFSESVGEVHQRRFAQDRFVVRSLHRIDQAPEHVPRVVADLGGHLHVADVADAR